MKWESVEPRLWLSTVAAVAAFLPGAVFSRPADSQPADSSTADANSQSDSGGLQEIVVTARKRSEDIQQTPIAITAFTRDDLENHGIVAIQNLAAQTPSLSFQSSPYDSVGSFIGMRGQQATDIVITQTPPVGIYVDDVYYPTTLATQLENFQGVQQIEVLKGPQGTLYGRNTTGGAIKITTQLPDYSGVNGEAKIGYGRKVQARLNAGRPNSLSEERLKMVEAYWNILEKFDRTLPLSDADRAVVRKRADEIKGNFLVEQGKSQLKAGEFGKAREFFAEANKNRKAPRLSLLLFGLRIAPHLTRTLTGFRNRMMSASARPKLGGART